MSRLLHPRVKLDAGPNVAKWNQLLIPGTFFRSDFGSLTFDGAFFGAILQNWNRAGSRPLPVDYFHRGQTGDDLPAEEKIAAGWINQLEIRPDGLWALIQWTDRARGYILADELRYLSATFLEDMTDKRTGQPQGPTLLGAALLNDPFLSEMPRVAASASPSTTRQPSPTEQPMNLLAAICHALGLPENTTQEDMMTHLSGLVQKCAALPKDTIANDQLANVPDMAKGTTPDQIAKTIGKDNSNSDPMLYAAKVDEAVTLATKPLNEALELARENSVKLAKRVETLEKEKFDTSVTGLCQKLLTEGKIKPVQFSAVREFAQVQGLEKAATFFAALPKMVTLGEEGVDGDPEAKDTAEKDQYFAEVEKVQKARGLSFVDATAIVNRTQPKLARSLSVLTPPKAS